MSLKASVAAPVFIPLRRFAGEIGRSRQFLYSEMKLGRLKTVLHGGRRFVHRDESERYIAAVLAASTDYSAARLPSSASQTANHGLGKDRSEKRGIVK